MGRLREDMEALAAQFSGEYDGWETESGSFDSETVGRDQKAN